MLSYSFTSDNIIKKLNMEEEDHKIGKVSGL